MAPVRAPRPINRVLDRLSTRLNGGRNDYLLRSSTSSDLASTAHIEANRCIVVTHDCVKAASTPIRWPSEYVVQATNCTRDTERSVWM